MFCDIATPENNEKELITAAEKLGTEAVAFAYEYADKAKAAETKAKAAQLQKGTSVKLAAIFKAEGNRIYKAKENGETVIAEASENSRDIIGRHAPHLVYNLELSKRKDFSKTRNSGLDKATCQLAARNGVTVVFAFSSVLNSKDLAGLLGRIKQNIRLCRKYKVKTAIASMAAKPSEMRAEAELKSLLLSIGMDTLNSKASLNSAAETVRGKLQKSEIFEVRKS